MSNKTKRHDDRKDLIGEHAFGDLGQLILLAIFLIIWVTLLRISEIKTSGLIEMIRKNTPLYFAENWNADTS